MRAAGSAGIRALTGCDTLQPVTVQISLQSQSSTDKSQGGTTGSESLREKQRYCFAVSAHDKRRCCSGWIRHADQFNVITNWTDGTVQSVL
jgi:hypothetical protein